MAAKPIPETEHRRLLELVSEIGPDRSLLAARMGMGLSSLNSRIQSLGERYHDAVEGHAARMRAHAEVAPVRHSRVAELLQIPPAPFAVKIPAPAASSMDGKAIRAVVFGDTHVPFHDEGALAVVEAVIKDVKPHILVHLGDLLDAGMLSQKFPTDPRRLDTLQADIDAARAKLHQWAKLAPQAERWVFEGNHEQRLARLIWSLQGAQRELAKLDAFSAALSWPNLLQTAAIGWRWVGYDEQPARDCLPKMLVKHGDRVSKWGGFTAKAEWLTYGCSGISGHTHRANIWRHKDNNGQATWIECGCTASLRTPGARDPDWQQAVTVLEWNADRSLMHAEQVLIRDGRAIWGGKEYAA